MILRIDFEKGEPMIEEIRKMESGFFGFGRWEAPYWFIGPEPGGDNNSLRAKKWITDFGMNELVDCKDFHLAINETKWYQEKPLLQPTWRRLMVLLVAFKSVPLNQDELRSYQCAHWGRRDLKACKDETCVIDLTGLSFKSVKDSDHLYSNTKGIGSKADMLQKKQMRAKCIGQKIHEGGYTPELVVMYGYSHQKLWDEISGISLGRQMRRKAGKPYERPEIHHLIWNEQKGGSTVFVYAPHPNARGFTDLDWETMGQRARERRDEK